MERRELFVKLIRELQKKGFVFRVPEVGPAVLTGETVVELITGVTEPVKVNVLKRPGDPEGFVNNYAYSGRLAYNPEGTDNSSIFSTGIIHKVPGEDVVKEVIRKVQESNA